MRFPRHVRKSASVYHLDSNNNYPGSADATVEGALLPMDRHAHALEGGDFVHPYEFYADDDADIRKGDKLVIGSTNYYAKHVFSADFGGHPHVRVSLSKE